MAMATVLTVMTASVALADNDGPTCVNQQAIDEGFDLGVENHGGHVIRDYVDTNMPGGPAPGGHFLGGVKPGASFCLEGSNSDVLYDKNPNLTP